MTDLAAAPFVPPAVKPLARQAPFWRRVRLLLDNPIEAWPRQVFEEPFFAPKVPWGPPFAYVCDPAALREIFLDQIDAFPKGAVFERMLKPALGEGLLTAEGAHWRWQRQAAAPAFRHDRILALTPLMRRAAEATLDRWRTLGDGARVDVAEEMVETTFHVILDTMLSGGEGLDVAAASRSVSAYLETIGKVNIADIFGWPVWARRLLEGGGGRARDGMRGEVERIVAIRRAEGPGRDDLVEMLLAARDPETGRAMTDRELVDNLLTFIGAGHETTALALTWTLYLLGRQPHVAERVRAEVLAVVGQGPIEAAHVERLVYARQVVNEAMRLYPPVSALPRVAARDVTVAGRAIAKGTFVMIPIYAIHRHRRLWDNPDVFDPDRFAPEHGLERKRFQFMPFGAGPRICIGATFAMVEAVTILATLVRAARFEPDPTHPIRPLVRITMRPQGGMPMTLRLG